MSLVRLLIVAMAVLVAAGPCRADDLRNIKRGEPVPAYRLSAIDGSVVDSQALNDSVVVIVCLLAEQRRSEMAAMDSSDVVRNIADDRVKLVHVTADVIQKSYFEQFRRDRAISAPLALDPDHALYAKLGLIVFPTTLVVNPDGKLAQVISLHGDAYKHDLDAYIRHSLGSISDDELARRLAEPTTHEGTPKSLASAHRALARSMRQKGRLDAARQELNLALQQDPDNREILLDLADLDLATGDFDAADATVRKVLQAQPDHRRAKQLQGIVLFDRGRFDEAEAVLVEALTLNPTPEIAHYYLGRICEQQGRTTEALEHYREALQRFIEPYQTMPKNGSAEK